MRPEGAEIEGLAYPAVVLAAEVGALSEAAGCVDDAVLVKVLHQVDEQENWYDSPVDFERTVFGFNWIERLVVAGLVDLVVIVEV